MMDIFGAVTERGREAGGRMMTAFWVACCLSPLVLIGGVYFTGKNEIDDVCADKVIALGKEKTTDVGCDGDAADKSLPILVRCNISEDVSPDLAQDVASPFTTNSKFVGLRVETEMYQCVKYTETVTGDKKSKSGKDKSVTITYYEKAWRKDWVDSTEWDRTADTACKANYGSAKKCSFDKACGVNNPQFPDENIVPKSQERRQKELRFGKYRTKNADLINKVSLSKDVTSQFDLPAVSGWSQSDGYAMYTGAAVTPTTTTTTKSSPILAAGGSASLETARRLGDDEDIGTMRVRMFANDWKKKQVTVVGKAPDKDIEPFVMPSSWMCGGEKLLELYEGQDMTVDQVYEKMQAEKDAGTFMKRILGFLLIWLAFGCMCAPVSAFFITILECSCILMCFDRERIENFVQGFVCMVASCPAAACFILVAGFMWLWTRPLKGMLFFGTAFLIFAGFGAAVYFGKKKYDERTVTAAPGPAPTPQVEMSTPVPYC